MAEEKPPDDTGTIYYVKQLSIEKSVIQQLNIVASPEADEDQRVPVLQETESDAINPSCKEFLKNKEWSRLSRTIFMYNVSPLRPDREVYKAKQVHASGRVRDVVVKLIHTAEEHMRELDCLLKLTDHPNIVKILESGTCTQLVPRIYIVMEQCHQNFGDYIKDNQFQLEKASTFFQQLVAAIVYIHQNEIAHRDLKPSNILTTIDGNVLKVSDFGISKELPSGLTKVTVTHPQAGTEGFKAPETYHDGKLGYKADIFPLAINAYYIFTHGQHPYGSNPHRQPVNIMDNQEPDLSQLPEFPEPGKKLQLNKLLRQMLQHNPDDRPTAKQVKEDVFFKGQENQGTDIPSGAEGSCAQVNPVAQDEATKECLATPAVKSSKAIDVSGFLQKYDAILQPDEATKLSNSLALATEMLQKDHVRGAISTLKDSIPKELSALDVKDFAFMLKKQGDYIYAMLMYRVSNEIFKANDTVPNNAIKWFKELVTCIRCSAAPLIMEDMGDLRDIAIAYSVEFMKNLLQDIRDVKNVSKDDKVLSEASCIVSISRISIDGKWYQHSISISEEGLQSLTKHFGEKAQEHKYYGQLLNNFGEALMCTGDYLGAEDYFKKALDAKKAATYGSRTMKRRDKKFTVNNLSQCQQKLQGPRAKA